MKFDKLKRTHGEKGSTQAKLIVSADAMHNEFADLYGTMAR